MDRLSAMAASGIRARMESLDLLANNIANASTAGFKVDREFYSVYAAEEAQEPGGAREDTQPVIERRWTDLGQGAITTTSNALDVALSGPGFFAANGPNGPVYTRNGNFRIGNDGVLQTAEGYAVRGDSGKPIRLDPARPVVISPEGVVAQEDVSVGKLELVDTPGEGTLNKMGNTYFQLSNIDAISKASASTKIQQGSLEFSNGSPAEQAVRLVSVMRQFEMLQKAVSMGNEMNRKAIEDVGRVSS